MSDEITYSMTFPVLWSDLDANGHMRAARYLEYATELTFHFLIEYGFDFGLFALEQVGPVSLRQEVRHLKEVRFGDQITVAHRLLAMSPNGSRWAFRDRITRRDGVEAAIVEIEGAFFSRATRKISPPPAGLMDLVRRLSREDDFAEL